MRPGMTELLRDLVDLRDLLGAQRPFDRPDVLLDLLDPGGAGDDACYLRPRRQPREGEAEHRVAARLREGLQLFDDILVAWRDVAIAQRRRLYETCIRRRGGAALVFAGQQAAGQREERQQAELVLLRRRQQILFDLAHHQAVFVLARHEWTDVEGTRSEFGFGDAPCRQIRIADVAHLALPD